MPSQADVASSIIAALAVTEPTLDTSVGSVARKIIDAVSSSISGITIDNQIIAYQYDVTSMTGANLDAFVQLFGLSRYPASSATGTITFAVTAIYPDPIPIPVSAQVTSSDGSVVAQTLTAASLAAGATSVTVPVQVVTAGPAGNVAAGTLTVLATPVTGISVVTNVAPTTGGTLQETDSQLQARWSATVFRNMAGTSSMYLGLALAALGCTGANVLGASKTWTEQLQIESGSATSSVPDAAYVYGSGQVIGNDISGGDIAVPGLQYTWNAGTIPPTITVLDSSYFPNGDIIDVTFQYVPVWSRNAPATQVTNKIDVWCAGVNAVPAAQTAIFSNALVFSSSSASTYYYLNYIRPDGTNPLSGNIFIPLAWGPVVTMDATIVIGGTTYGLVTPAHAFGSISNGVTYAYQIVHENDAHGWGPHSRFGLEWLSTELPANNTPFTVGTDYAYNNVPAMVQNSIANWSLAGTDALAHQAVEVPLQISLAVIYDPSVTVSVTQAAINTGLSAFFSVLGFSATIYPSSVIQAVENTTGVIAARFLVGSDIAGFNGSTPDLFTVGIQQLNPTGTTTVKSFVDTSGNPVDIILGDAQVPAFGATVQIAKAVNTFGSYA
jgi:uncharacterized phage protein gp47/JayE